MANLDDYISDLIKNSKSNGYNSFDSIKLDSALKYKELL